ncbi:hypothetical protein JN086_14350 [Mycolicibacterium austroafricanum]|uniref:Uncharacterized protein n=1 Tax=Mycolicibacterium austroafricanum TaxID=39687 RepID=A0ABT8HJ33_MYCAO|nr:hypothetical protein [Mycolicibacterium austroafricanum]MDN4520520.1 hypothetical protein [Mycolicibacterium austroafricanum]QRZ09401.1 hypothetical protein JN090_13385 [Mycolicibacterium austroafricanum]QZT71053.1 hypothetical protein JN086_14350 [Mycolicibacterium austroafricanum]
MSRSLLDVIRPFQGRHNHLRGGWSDDQLQVVAEALGTASLTTAAIACSLVAEERTTATALRYSRSQRNYTFNEAFRGDPLMTYRRVIAAVDFLVAQGYAMGLKGSWLLSKQSILSATPKLVSLVGHLVDVSERLSATLKDEIVLRDKDGHSVGFCDTDEIRRMRQDMKVINAHLSAQQYYLRESQLYIPPGCPHLQPELSPWGPAIPSGQQLPADVQGQASPDHDGARRGCGFADGGAGLREPPYGADLPPGAQASSRR